MDLFELLIVLDSIIIGLGLSEVLTGVGQLLRARGSVRVSGIHGLVVGLILLVLLQHWWDAWGLRGIAEWTFPALLLFVSGPILLFLLGYLAFPQSVAEWDLEQYYYRHAPLLWGLGALYLLTTILFRPVVLDVPLLSQKTLLRTGALVLCLSLAVSGKRSFHRIGVGAAVLAFAVYVLTFAFRQTQ